MYEGEENYTSDLVNSYAWDTAIVFIEKMEDTNYSNANRDTTGKKSLMNTGETGDEKCHIFDMSANVFEYTTEYSTNTRDGGKYPCVLRGGCYDSSSCTASRYSYEKNDCYSGTGFRPLLYLK